MCENPVPIAQKEQKLQQEMEETGTIRNFEFVDCWLKYIEEVPDVGVQWRGKHFYLKVDRLYEDRRCRTKASRIEGGRVYSEKGWAKSISYRYFIIDVGMEAAANSDGNQKRQQNQASNPQCNQDSERDSDQDFNQDCNEDFHMELEPHSDQGLDQDNGERQEMDSQLRLELDYPTELQQQDQTGTLHINKTLEHFKKAVQDSILCRPGQQLNFRL